jgi:two-component system, cell cycle sensor histidine kinase and response regulator CckA
MDKVAFLSWVNTSNAIVRYAVGLLAAAVAAVVTVAAFPMPELRPYYFFIGAIAVATWFGGLGPGALSTFLGAVLGVTLIPWHGPLPKSSYVNHYVGFVAVAMLVFALAAALHKTAAAQRRSSTQFGSMVRISDDAIMTIDEQQNITLFNPSAERIFGYSASEVLGKRLNTLLPERFRQIHSAHVQGFSTSPEALRSMNRRGIIYGLRKDGSEFPAEASISKFNSDGEKIMTVRLRDISERQRLEEQLRQSQKIEAVGRLAGGVAHDFNNLLGVIVGYTYLIQSNHSDSGQVRAAADQVMAAADRAGSLTRQLLAFSRKQVIKPEVIDLNDITESLGKMIPRLVTEDIDVRIVRGEELKAIEADPNQIEQVIMNLVVNARDAMPSGGRLTIETGNVFLNEDEARRHDVVSGDYVLLAVSDTGHGMDENTRTHIFEPFFTTKDTGKGTGLGLATVYGIVRQSDGYIWVYSEPSHGTTFKIYFPATTASVEPPQQLEQEEAALCGTETILLVEDQEHLRELLVNVLRTKGYKVLSASNGADALQLVRTESTLPVLLLTDVIMPGMRGPQLAAELSRRYPDLRILYMSGFTDNALMHSGSLPESTLFLQKPFTPELLFRRVREVLDESSTLPPQFQMRKAV